MWVNNIKIVKYFSIEILKYGIKPANPLDLGSPAGGTFLLWLPGKQVRYNLKGSTIQASC